MPEVSPNFTNALHSGGEPPLLAVGLTCRALAEAMTSEGFKAACIDAFGDEDLREISLLSCIPEQWLESSIIEAVHKTINRGQQADQPHAALLAGGIEHRPSLNEFLHTHLLALGPNPGQVNALRSPAFLGQLAEAAGLRMPAMLDRTDRRPANLPPGSWLRKPLASGGGMGICRIADSRRIASHESRETYLQHFIAGRSTGATLILNSQSHKAESCRLLGLTESFTEFEWPGPSEFVFRGCLGPIAASLDQIDAIHRFGRLIAQELNYRGWLQLDFIESADGQLWLLEANPRWTAGMEILQLCGLRPLREHLDCFVEFGQQGRQQRPPSELALDADPSPNFASKAIVYAEQDIELKASLLKELHQLPREYYCDLPSAQTQNQIIERGHPLLTVRHTHSQPVPKESSLSVLNDLRAQVMETLN